MCLIRVSIVHGQTDADGQLGAALVRQNEGFVGDPTAQYFSDAEGGVLVTVDQEQKKLLAAQTKQEIASTAAVVHQHRELLQHVITGFVSEGVVDAFEMIDIDASTAKLRLWRRA